MADHHFRAELAKAEPATNGLAAKTEALKLDAAASGPPQSKVRSKGLDVPKLWGEEEATRKSTAGFVVVGHVDHGKSTLMGRLLLDTGAVSQREVDKCVYLILVMLQLQLTTTDSRNKQQISASHHSHSPGSWIQAQKSVNVV